MKTKATKNKKIYTQKEYDDRGTQMFELGKKEGRQLIKKEFQKLFDLDLCASIDEGIDEEEEEWLNETKNGLVNYNKK